MKYNDAQLTALLPHPATEAHKYSRGKAVLVAGSAKYPGAACLAASACERMGAGYTQVLCAPEAVQLVRAASSSLVVDPWDNLVSNPSIDGARNSFQANLGPLRPQSLKQSSATNSIQSNKDTESNSACGTRLVRAAGADLPAYANCSTGADLPASEDSSTNTNLPRAQAYLVGSGFEALGAQDTCVNGRESLGAQSKCVMGEKIVSSQSARLTLGVLAAAQAPVVVDGGGLAAIATPEGRQVLKERFGNGLPTILTPHAGEATRLAEPFDFDVSEPLKLAQKLSLAYGAVIVLKGPVTYISDGETTVEMDKGSSALAKAGTGDVLAGMLTSLLAQKLEPMDACALATNLHALAGRAAAKELTDICVCAHDVVDFLPNAIKKLMKDGIA